MYWMIGAFVIAGLLFLFRDRIGPVWSFLGTAVVFTMAGVKTASRKPEVGSTKPYRDPIIEGHKRAVENANKTLTKIKKKKEAIDEKTYERPDGTYDPDLVRDLESVLRGLPE